MGSKFSVNGSTRICGLIGRPVEHTFSPKIHNFLAKKYGHNLVYLPFSVEEEGLQKAVEGAFALNILGMNVTVPYKSEVIKYLVGTDEVSAKIGAVNTLVRVRNGFKGYNTDISGLARAMEKARIRVGGQEVIILGAGGAARSVAYLCAERKAAHVYMLNRTFEKAEALAKEVNTVYGTELITPMPLSDYTKLPDRKFLAVQATILGLWPRGNEAVIDDSAFYKKIHTGFDLVYQPLNTCFMQNVRVEGGKAFNGMNMLIYQAMNAYEMWNNIKLLPSDADAVAEMLKKEMGLY